MKNLLACLLVVAMSGCPDVEVDPDEVFTGATVEFDPARSLSEQARFIPFPNDLARDPMTGLVSLGEQACETPASKATRENILNQLDGFGTYQTAMQVTFTAPVDPASLEGNIVMFQLTSQGEPLSPADAMPIPVQVVRVGQSPRFTATSDCDADPSLVDSVTFVPLVPLEQKSTYFVALLSGIQTDDGRTFTPSTTWALVASQDNPVTLDEQGQVVSDRTPLDPSDPAQRMQLQSLAQIWMLHSIGLGFYEQTPNARPRADIVVGFQFTTQTVSDPLDPTVEGSPANNLASVGLLQSMSVTGRFGAQGAGICTTALETNQTQCFLKLALGGCSPLTTGCGLNNYMAGAAACQLLNCAAIGDVVGGGIATANYQAQLPNPLPDGAPIQGAWSDPVDPEQQASLILETLVVLPTGVPPNSAGWPTVVFAHPISSSKESALAIAGRLAAAGFATVAIDSSAHGSRAVRISRDPALGCIGQCFSGTTPTGTECDTTAQCNAGETCGSATAMPGFLPPSPTTAPQCYASFLSPDLAATRDGIRQTVLDHLRVINAIKTCGVAGCAAVSFNPERIYVLGMSVGGFIGGISASMSPDVDAAVLNATGVGWGDFLENTETLAIRCQLVNGLIDAGILVGEKWTGGETGLCTTDEWKMQPGWATFSAIGRWVLDPADPANFVARLRTRPVLVQEIDGDTVVPNVTTQRLAALLGLTMPTMADPFNNAPSAAITDMPMTSKYLRYVSDADNVFAHPSLLRPAPTTDAQDGINGTLRLQVDASTYLNLNDQ